MTNNIEAAAGPDEELKAFAKEAGLDLEEPAKPEAEEKSEVKGEEPAKTDEVKVEDSQVPDDELDEEEVEEKSEIKATRIPKVVPAYKLKILEKRAQAREQELLEEIDTLKNKPSDTPKQQENINTKIKALSEKFGLDEDLIKEIVDLNSGHVPKELTDELRKELEEVKGLKTTLLDQKEKAEFENDFRSNVLPLIKDEYTNISDSDLAKLKTRLEKAAYLKEYATTPLAVLYRGLDNFRPIKGRKSVEPSDGGKGRNEGAIDFESTTSEQIEKWSDSEDPADKELLTKYFAYHDSKTKR